MAQHLTLDPGLPASSPTSSYWQIPPHKDLIGVQSATLPQTRDIVIVGSGITGCSAALELLKSNDRLSITVLDAREICSGATGRNGGRINCVAVLDYDKYRKKLGHDAAVEIVRFEMAHYETILSTAREYAPDLSKESRVREVATVAAVFSEEKLAELKQLLKDFESAFPDLKGRWRVADREEVVQVSGRGNPRDWTSS